MVMARRRVELAERGIRSAIQPYHAAASMELPEAEEFLSRSAASALAMAKTGVRQILADLKDYEVAGACVLMASGRPLGDLAKTLGSHALMHTAEGEFFRDAIRKACEICGVTILGVKEKEYGAGPRRR